MTSRTYGEIVPKGKEIAVEGRSRHRDAAMDKEKAAEITGHESGNFCHDFSRIPARNMPGISRDVSNGASKSLAPDSAAMTHVLALARSDHAMPLDRAVRQPLEEQFGRDLSGVRVFEGYASTRAAETLGARAYTLGNSIHLGREASSLNPGERARLLTHEAVHTIQQGGRPVSADSGLRVSFPHDPAEAQAEEIARFAATAHGSPSLALRNQFRSRSLVSEGRPLVQRDLKGKYALDEGQFNMDLKTESHAGAKSGMSGTIAFKAAGKAPDSTNIRLLQVVRVENLGTGKDYKWTGSEANRNKVMTTAAPGVEPGFFVDHSAAAASPRTKSTDAAVSPYYRDYWANPAESHDGSKKGTSVTEASLWDYPGANFDTRFSFETVAKGADTGHVYGTVMWGFTISNASKGTVDHERAVGRDVTLLTTDKAIEKFNQFYRNPGASTAP
jgi:hypothetical protein